MEVPWEDASRFGLMVADGDDRITEFQEKPKNPKSNLASMGIYIFNWDILRQYLIEDEADPDSENDFGNNIIPNLLRDGRRMYAYHFNGYWKDVGTISSLWEANMEVLDPEPVSYTHLDVYKRQAQALGVPIGRVRIIKPYIGGGFGNKQDVLYEPLNAFPVSYTHLNSRNVSPGVICLFIC